MSNNNKLEITITSTRNNLDEEKLKLYLVSRCSANIKKCKVLSDGNKAFVTFQDSKSYDAALQLMPRQFEILPTNISLTHIYRNQQMIKRKLIRIDVVIQKVLDFMNGNFQTLEDEVINCMLFTSDKISSNVVKIAERTSMFKDDKASCYDKEASSNEEESNIFKDDKTSSYDEEQSNYEEEESNETENEDDPLTIALKKLEMMDK
eukprot:306467_1